MDVEYTGRQTTITKKLKLQTEAGLVRIAKIVGQLGQCARDSYDGEVSPERRAYGADQTTRSWWRAASRPRWRSRCAMRWSTIETAGDSA